MFKAIRVKNLIKALQREEPEAIVKFFDGEKFIVNFSLYDDDWREGVGITHEKAIILDTQQYDDAESEIIKEFGEEFSNDCTQIQRRDWQQIREVV